LISVHFVNFVFNFGFIIPALNTKLRMLRILIRLRTIISDRYINLIFDLIG
jgi:hypothetical protein